MFSNQFSGEHLPRQEKVVAEEEEVAEVEVEVGAVEDHLDNLTRPSNQWRKPLMFKQWEKYPKTSLGTEKRLITSSRKYEGTYALMPTLVASTRQRRRQPSHSCA
jgi:hypothetical protein